MKKAYKDLIIKWLDENPETNVECFPGGWTQKFLINGQNFSDGDRIWQMLRDDGNIEKGLIYKHIYGSIYGNYASFAFKYDKDEKDFKGDVKYRDVNIHSFEMDIEPPSDIWFSTLNITLNISSKKSVSCDISTSIKNGLTPPDMKEMIDRLELNITNRALSELSKVKGRVCKMRINERFNYSKKMTIRLKLDSITYRKEKKTIKF